MEVITINVSKEDLAFIAKIQDIGICPSRSEFIRICIRQGIPHFLDQIKDMRGITPEIENDPTKIRIPNGDGTYNMHQVIRRLD